MTGPRTRIEVHLAPYLLAAALVLMFADYFI